MDNIHSIVKEEKNKWMYIKKWRKVIEEFKRSIIIDFNLKCFILKLSGDEILSPTICNHTIHKPHLSIQTEEHLYKICITYMYKNTGLHMNSLSILCLKRITICNLWEDSYPLQYHLQCNSIKNILT